MILFVAVIGGLILSILVYLGVFSRLSRKKNLDLLDWFLLAFGTVNGVGWSFVIWATVEGRNIDLWIDQLAMFDLTVSVYYISSNLIFLFSVVFGWHLLRSLIGFRHVSPFYPSSRLESNVHRIKSVAWFMAYAAAVAYGVYTIPYGGFSGVLVYSRAIRAGIATIYNPYSYLKIFGSFAFFSSYIFFGLLIDKDISTKRQSSFVGFIFSFLFSLYVLNDWLGRMGFAVYLLTFLLGLTLYRSRKSVIRLVRKLVSVFFIALLLIVFSDMLLGGTGQQFGVVELFAKELSFPFASYSAQVHSYELSWFKHLLATPLYILPERIWSGVLGIDTASRLNTLVVMGAGKNAADVTGGVPVDLITFFFMQGSVFGIIIGGFIWGGFLLALERSLQRIALRGIRCVIYANVVLSVVSLSVLYGDPYHIVTRNFALIVGSLLLWVINIKWGSKSMKLLNQRSTDFRRL